MVDEAVGKGVHNAVGRNIRRPSRIARGLTARVAPAAWAVRADRSISVPTAARRGFDASTPVAVCFETDRSMRDLLARIFHDRTLLRVRLLRSGLPPRPAMRALARLRNVRFVFTDEDWMRRMVVAFPFISPPRGSDRP